MFAQLRNDGSIAQTQPLGSTMVLGTRLENVAFKLYSMNMPTCKKVRLVLTISAHISTSSPGRARVISAPGIVGMLVSLPARPAAYVYHGPRNADLGVSPYRGDGGSAESRAALDRL